MNRREITDRFIAAIAKGNVPWRQPFAKLPHRNPFTGTIYRGVNQLLLALNDNTVPHWGTFNQWKNAGCNVRRGAKATPVVFYTTVEKVKPSGEEISYPLLRKYFVFHAGQIDDPQGKFKDILETKIETNFEMAARIIDSCGADIRIGGNAAFFRPADNFIRIPHSSQFHSEEARLATAFHELAHWAAGNILGHKISEDARSSEYAFAELVAEIAACFLCQACGIPTDWENHEGYIADWLTAMKNDTAYIWTASRDAAKIADAILQRAGVKNESEPDDAPLWSIDTKATAE